MALKVRLASSSGVFALLSHEDFGFYTPAIRAVELVDSKVAPSCMWFYNRQP
jgi:hypothetical protein